MKKFLSGCSALLCAAVFIPTAWAHTHLTDTTPADGETVTEAISELTLQFDGQVGEGSFIELTNSANEAIVVKDITIGEMAMTATLAEPLANEQYQVEWSIISADGHPLEGSYTFTVDAPVVEEVVKEDALTEQPTSTNVDVENETTNDATETAEDGNNFILIIAAVLAVVIIGSFIALLKRKK